MKAKTRMATICYTTIALVVIIATPFLIAAFAANSGALSMIPLRPDRDGEGVCAKMVHALAVNSTINNTLRASTDDLPWDAPCPRDSIANVPPGECRTLNVKWHKGPDALAPATPKEGLLYWRNIPDGPWDPVWGEHGRTGKEEWGQIREPVPLRLEEGERVTRCHEDMVHSGDWGTNYTAILRLCGSLDELGCRAGTFYTYDINTDENAACRCQGDPGAGYVANRNGFTITVT